MKYLKLALTISIVAMVFNSETLYSQSVNNSSDMRSKNSNIIRGFIFDALTRNPVADVYVELQNDLYVTLKRSKTDASGQYSFMGLSSGTFKVKVAPYGTNYREETQDATLTNYSIGSNNTSDSVYLDFYLRIDKRKANIEKIAAGTVFVQEVPDQAKSLFKEAISKLTSSSQNKTEAIEKLKKAINVFPNYYDALNQLALELVKAGQYNDSIPLLIKVIELNPRSLSGFYLLGVAAYNLKQYKEAAEAFRAATLINSQFVDSFIQQGMVLRIDGKYEEAEKVLLKSLAINKESPDSDSFWQLALLYDKIKKYNQAADCLEKYLEIEKDAKNQKQIRSLISQFRSKSKSN